MRPPMRSSIACTHCRKSKIKCENNGGVSPCDSCIKTGKECVFSHPDPVPPKRSEPPTGAKQERDGGSDRKKLKKIDDISKVDNQRASVYAEEVLSAPFLTEDLWEQVLDLYKLHFATELPFLHLPTMKEKLGRKFKAPEPESSPESSSELNLVLLGVLTLTARFHPDLVKYLAHICNNQPGNARTRPVQTQLDPTAASEYYADILTMALGPLRTTMKVASAERVAAFLMLGLYEWSQTRPKTGGLGAWMYVGIAIRMAQYLGLGFGDIPGSGEAQAIDHQRRNSNQQSQVTLDKEIRRRTMYSCFILDRMLACGKERVSNIQAEDIQIQLPCSEDKFDLAMEVQTGFLKDRVRHGLDDSVLSRFVQLVDLWGEISKFSSQGGRLHKKEADKPPWYKESTFAQLSEKLAKFDAELPGTFTFSRSNYFRHENHQASSVYVLLHMLRCVCLIMLHREYIPFVPVSCKKPTGPLDKPTFPEDEFGAPPEGFWILSAEQVFKAARDIVDLIEICQRKDKMPQSTIVLFAIWTAGFVGLYAEHFPAMDTEKHMLCYDFEYTRHQEPVTDFFKRGSVAFAYVTLQKMSVWLKMASTYVKVLRQMDKYFDTIKQDYFRHVKKNAGPNPKTFRVRDGGIGGAVEEYTPVTTTLKDMGFVHPIEHDHIESLNRSSPGTADRISSASSSLSRSTSTSTSRSQRPNPMGSFTAINHTPIAPAPDPSRPLSNGGGCLTPVSEVYAGSVRHHSKPHPPQQQPPSLQIYPTLDSTVDPAAVVAAEASGRAFSVFFKKEADRRIGTIGDLGFFSSGDPQLVEVDLSFGEETDFVDPSFQQYMQQVAGY
ncbi:hypothetical protein GGR54DRAFT_630527 [Hypoxylon sp. NC1633]|nr:hypothetical protein GGR54DRAFT_630527 [Hypoxylon sp. NC1633]